MAIALFMYLLITGEFCRALYAYTVPQKTSRTFSTVSWTKTIRL